MGARAVCCRTTCSINDPTKIAQRAVATNLTSGYSAGQVNVSIDAPSQLSTSDYEVRFDRVGNGAFTLVRIDDGKIVAEGSVGQGLPTHVSADGFTVEIRALGREATTCRDRASSLRWSTRAAH